MSTAPMSAAIPGAAAFAEQGFFVARGLFADRIAALEASFDRIVAQLAASGEEINARWAGEESDRLNGPGRVVLHTHNVHLYDAAWATLWWEPRFTDLGAAFLGPDLVLHHTKLFQKPAGRGAAFPMHQDWDYFPISGDRCLAAIVHVTAADEATGCLRIVPGSHRAGRLDDSRGQGAVSELQRRYPLESSVAVPCAAGDVVFFHCLTVHGSGVNSDPERVRKTVLAQVYDATAQPEADRHYNARFMLRGRNPHMTRNAKHG